jgi:hypothetical protein
MIKLFKCQSADELQQHNMRIESSLKGTLSIPNLDILEVNEYPSLCEILQFSETYCASKNFKTLFDYLDSFPNEERNEKILEYNKSLNELKRKKAELSQSMDLGFSFISDFSGVPFLGTIANMAKLGVGKFLEKNESLRNKLNEMRNLIKPDKPIDKQATRFLSQISPVARLKTHC